ncbi:hypothetical protein F4604DRAFT_1991910 [Suillus subluteus]|nr:hypothetical protein F4604DRAFT_1991910 [Suillus subluteus]
MKLFFTTSQIQTAATPPVGVQLVSFQINQFRDALDAYPHAIRINPYISEVWFDLGSLYESCNNQISDAIDDYYHLQVLKNVQAKTASGQLPAAPGPQDMHPTAYANSVIIPPPGQTSSPLLLHQVIRTCTQPLMPAPSSLLQDEPVLLSRHCTRSSGHAPNRLCQHRRPSSGTNQSSSPAAPDPQDMHPTAYVSANIPPPGRTSPPLLLHQVLRTCTRLLLLAPSSPLQDELVPSLTAININSSPNLPASVKQLT